MSPQKPTTTIGWIHILNEQTVWTKPDDVSSWVSSLSGRRVDLSANAVSEFIQVLNDMRDLLQELHFSREIRLDTMNHKVESIRLGFQNELGGLPLFRALPRGPGNDALLHSIGETALVQFCTYVGDVQAGRPFDLARCEGLFRDQAMKTISPAHGASIHREIEWRCEIPILVEESLQESADVHRCADFFLGSKGKFCSDACRFATFQMVKQLKDPEYLADKQRRYRARKK